MVWAWATLHLHRYCAGCFDLQRCAVGHQGTSKPTAMLLHPMICLICYSQLLWTSKLHQPSAALWEVRERLTMSCGSSRYTYAILIRELDAWRSLYKSSATLANFPLSKNFRLQRGRSQLLCGGYG
jgi:hypothetical protein